MLVLVLYLPLLTYLWEKTSPLHRSGEIMAIIQSALLSKGRGSAGSVTFRRLNGKTVVSEKPLVVKNPDTFAQRRSRMIFMAGANEGWALSPYFAARPKLAGVRNSTGVSARGSKLLPLQDFIKRAVKAVKDDDPASTQLSSYAGSVPSNQVDYSIKGSVLVASAASPVAKALSSVDVTGLPGENSELAIGSISVGEGVVQFPVTVDSESGISSVRATVYVIVAVTSDGGINRYMITRTVGQTVQAEQPTNIQASIQVPQGQIVHRIIVEVVPTMDAGATNVLEPNYALTVGADVLLND